MKIEKMTNQVITNDTIVEIFKDIILFMNKTEYNKSSFSITDIKTKTGILLNTNTEWVNKYIDKKLFKEDPVTVWEDKVYHVLFNSKLDKVFYRNFDEIHSGKNGDKFREIRNEHSIKSGGTTISKLGDVMITLNWWSSNKDKNFLDDYSNYIKRTFFIDIEKQFIDIYNKNYNLIFKDKKLEDIEIIIDI